MSEKPFSIELNLDDDIERSDFIKSHGTTSGQLLAKRLGFAGRDSARAARALSNYAWNKNTAALLRRDGKIDRAIEYEKICDAIYTRDILPLISCW